MELLVRTMTLEAEGVLSVELVSPTGDDLPGWEPGAHLDVRLGSLSRQYSLAGDPADRGRYRLGVLLEPESRGGSAFVHRALRPGDLVDATGPRNHFRLEPAARAPRAHGHHAVFADAHVAGDVVFGFEQAVVAVGVQPAEVFSPAGGIA
jgi:ferredoxin-NADP reductase